MAVQKRAHGVALRLWQRVQRELADRDWTDTKFQEETGISRPTLERLRTNLRTPRRATVKTLAEAFDIDIDEALALAGIIEDEGDTEPDEPPGPPLHDAEEREFWDLMVRSRVPAEMAVAQLEMFKASRRQAR